MNMDLLLYGLKPFLRVQTEGRDVASEMSLCTTPTLARYNRECNRCGITLGEHNVRNNLKADPEQQAACMGACKKGQRPENENVEMQDPSGPAVKTTRGTGTLLKACVSVLIPTHAVQTAA